MIYFLIFFKIESFGFINYIQTSNPCLFWCCQSYLKNQASVVFISFEVLHFFFGNFYWFQDFEMFHLFVLLGPWIFRFLEAPNNEVNVIHRFSTLENCVRYATISFNFLTSADGLLIVHCWNATLSRWSVDGSPMACPLHPTGISGKNELRLKIACQCWDKTSVHVWN